MLNNRLRRKTDMISISEEIMDFQRKERHDLMYQKAQKLGGKTSKTIKTFRIQDNQGKIVNDHQ